MVSDNRREPFLQKPRGWVSEQLVKLWKASRSTKPDPNKISDALDETVPTDGGQKNSAKEWLEAARKKLGL